MGAGRQRAPGQRLGQAAQRRGIGSGRRGERRGSGPADAAGILAPRRGARWWRWCATRTGTSARSLIGVLLAARPDLILVEMGLPFWRPPEGTSYLATYGASRASAQAAAELLGLAVP